MVRAALVIPLAHRSPRAEVATFYVWALLSTLALGLFDAELSVPNTPGVVDRADGWPESKARHMQEGDFWYWVETKTEKAQQDTSS